jgi:hypothetical protein
MSVTTDSPSPRPSVTPSGVSRRSGGGRGPRVRLGRAPLRLIACWRSGELDCQLAAGINPQTTTVLALHAERIIERRSRTRLANGLTRALRSARDTAPGFTAAVRPYAPELIAADSALAALHCCLRSPAPVNAQGVAILRALLTDAASPLYQPSEPGALINRLRTAAATLGPSDPPD